MVDFNKSIEELNFYEGAKKLFIIKNKQNNRNIPCIPDTRKKILKNNHFTSLSESYL